MRKILYLNFLILTTLLFSIVSCDSFLDDDDTNSDSIPASGFYIENKLIYHFDTKLMWADENTFKTPDEITSYCENYTLGDYDDWQVPTQAELGNFIKEIYADESVDPESYGTFPSCTAAIASDGYVKTPYGAEQYGGEPGDSINFSGGAALRCVRNFSDEDVPEDAKTNKNDDT